MHKYMGLTTGPNSHCRLNETVKHKTSTSYSHWRQFAITLGSPNLYLLFPLAAICDHALWTIALLDLLLVANAMLRLSLHSRPCGGAKLTIKMPEINTREGLKCKAEEGRILSIKIFDTGCKKRVESPWGDWFESSNSISLPIISSLQELDIRKSLKRLSHKVKLYFTVTVLNFHNSFIISIKYCIPDLDLVAMAGIYFSCLLLTLTHV